MHGLGGRFGVVRAVGDILNVASGENGLCHQMVVEFLHLGNGVKFAADPALIGDNETADAMPMKLGQRFGRTGHPCKVIHQMSVAMIDVQRLVAIQKHRAAPPRRCHA